MRFNQMKIFKMVMKWTKLTLLIVIAVAGGFVMIGPKRNEQDYDNEVKTELVEGKEDQLNENDKS